MSLRLSLFLIILTLLSTGHVFRKMPLSLSLYTGTSGLGEGDHSDKVVVSPYYRKALRSAAVTVTHRYWCWPWCPEWGSSLGFSTVRLPFFSFVTYCTIWKEFTMYSPPLRSGKLCCTFFRTWYLRMLFGIILFVYSPPVMYSLIIYL